jgi:hypothetical protein
MRRTLCAIVARIEPDHLDPFIDKPSILSHRQMPAAPAAAGEYPIIASCPALLKPCSSLLGVIQ